MKKVILTTILSLSITSAFAAETAVLKVTGTLTNASCTVELGNGGVFDYGAIRLGELSATQSNIIGEKQLPATIHCSAPTKVGFTLTDNRSDSNAGLTVPVGTTGGSTSAKYKTYGVGTTTNGVKIGSYAMWTMDPTVDGNSVDGIAHNLDWPDGKWTAASGPRSDAFSILTFAEKGTTTPMPITTASFNFVTNLVISDTATLAITDDTALDGQTTMTLVYL